MNARTVIQLVAGREIKDRLHNRAFIIGTLVMLLLVVGAVIGPSLFASDETPSFDLAVVGEIDPLFRQAVQSAATAQKVDVALTSVPDEAAADAGVEAGDLDAVLLDQDRLRVADQVNDTLGAVVEQARQQTAVLSGLSQAGVSPDQASSLLAGRAPVDVTTPQGTIGEADAGQAVAFVATILLFLILQINGSTLLTGTIEEKSSRVVEVLLGSVRPWQLLAGKLTGISALAIGQLMVFIAAALGANAAFGTFDIPPTTASAIGVGSLMFTVGFGFYAALYAVAGSMASSLEDAQASAGPLGILTAAAYIGTLIGVVPNPDTVFAQVMTYLPPTAPFAVPARISVGAISPIEVVIAVVLTAATAVATIRLAGRLYSAAILAGGKLTWREVLRAEPV